MNQKSYLKMPEEKKYYTNRSFNSEFQHHHFLGNERTEMGTHEKGKEKRMGTR